MTFFCNNYVVIIVLGPTAFYETDAGNLFYEMKTSHKI